MTGLASATRKHPHKRARVSTGPPESLTDGRATMICCREASRAILRRTIGPILAEQLDVWAASARSGAEMQCMFTANRRSHLRSRLRPTRLEQRNNARRRRVAGDIECGVAVSRNNIRIRTVIE